MKKNQSKKTGQRFIQYLSIIVYLWILSVKSKICLLRCCSDFASQMVIYYGIKRYTFFIWKWQILVTKLTELNSCLRTGEVFFYMYISCWWPHWIDGYPLVSWLVTPSLTLLTIQSAPDCAIIHGNTLKYVIIIMKVATNKLSAMSCSKSLFTQGFSFCQYLDILCRSGSDIYSR